MYYKVLNTDGSCYHGGSGVWPENEWMPPLNKSKLAPCEYGYHILEEQDIIYWLGPAIAPIELPPDVTITRHENKLVVDQARRLPFLATWNPQAQRLFAADCAEHVLHIFESKYPNDDRPRKAIEAARQPDAAARTAAADAAAHAADAAAYAAAYAARAAARAAADAAAAAYAAAYAARAAADAAAYAAARTAADERQWQTTRLMEYLNGALV